MTDIETRAVPTIEFIGVTTTQSSIMTLFPHWAALLGLRDAQIVGRDLPLNAAPEQYRRAVEQIKHDPLSLGALVTTHKINLLAAARDLFDALDPYAELCNEVSSIYKRDGRLIGAAKDPITAGRALGDVLPTGYTGAGSTVLCFGAGGAGTAISVHFIERYNAHGPLLMMVDRNQANLHALEQVHQRMNVALPGIIYLNNQTAHDNDGLMGVLPPGALVINATGMGKDIPGSPISDAAEFPQRGVVWELNYRGALDFLEQARRQQAAQGLRVSDGWVYFLHGWSSVIADVFGLEWTPELFVRLRAEAELRMQN